MSDINQFTFTGRLGKDPDSRTLPDGRAVCNFTVACAEKWKDKQSGEKKEKVEWVGCAAFGGLAEVCGKWLKKGSQIAASGKLSTRKWTDKNGVDRWTTEVMLDRMTMMGGNKEGGNQPPREQEKPKETAKDDDLDSDIPF